MAPVYPNGRPETPEERQKRLEPLIALRMKKREEWENWWKIWDYETQGRPYKRFKYIVWRYVVDWPATFWRENVIEPIQDKYGHWPYYHRKFRRVPTIDECHVNDEVCYHEAQKQYRLDKLVDSRILEILKGRREECLQRNHDDILRCTRQFEEFEEAELNWFIKYGEMGLSGGVLACYMKQKHRMIWERRNPQIMEERQKLYDEHKHQLSLGIYDHWFWKRAPWFNFKDYRASEVRNTTIYPYTFKTSDPDVVSMDPEYYKKRKEDEDKTKLASPFDILP